MTYVAAAYAVSLGGLSVLVASVLVKWLHAKKRLADLKISETNL